MKYVWVVIELHEDCPKIRAVCDNKADAERIAYKDNEYWRNIFRMEVNKEN